MDKDVFVQNAKYFCKIRGVKPTVACAESGVGTSFLTNVRRGNSPTVANVQKFASYLGVTTSQLLGEEIDTKKDNPNIVSDVEDVLDRELINRLCQLTPEEFARVDAFVQGILSSR